METVKPTERFNYLCHFEFQSLVEVMFGELFALSAVEFGLASNTFAVPWFAPNRRKTVAFTTGQPLGYYSSWPLFALNHHFLIWLAAEQVYPGRTFDRYAVLGDDVVIADEKVARTYERLLSEVSIPISTSKSLISDI